MAALLAVVQALPALPQTCEAFWLAAVRFVGERHGSPEEDGHVFYMEVVEIYRDSKELLAFPILFAAATMATMCV